MNSIRAKGFQRKPLAWAVHFFPARTQCMTLCPHCRGVRSEPPRSQTGLKWPWGVDWPLPLSSARPVKGRRLRGIECRRGGAALQLPRRGGDPHRGDTRRCQGRLCRTAHIGADTAGPQLSESALVSPVLSVAAVLRHGDTDGTIVGVSRDFGYDLTTPLRLSSANLAPASTSEPT